LPYGTNDYETTINKFLRALALNDSNIMKSYISKKTSGYINVESVAINTDNESTYELKYEQVYNSMGINLSGSVYWCEKLNQVKQYIDENKQRPSSRSKDPKIKSLGKWLEHQIVNYKKNVYIMRDPNIKAKWESFIELYKKYVISNEEIWLSKLNELRQYIDENKKRPSRHDKDKNAKILGSWITMQLINYKKNAYIMKDLTIRNKWKTFVDEYSNYFMSNEEVWENNLNLVKLYIDKNKKRPSSVSKDKNIKILGQWINAQLIRYKKNDRIMRHPIIRDKWKKFTTEYSNYFISNEELWETNLNQVKQYIEQNKKRPSRHDKDKNTKILGSWLSHQIANYKKNTEIMNDPIIRSKWEEFITEYSNYFISNEEAWENNLTEVKLYIDENKKRPSRTDKDKIIKTLGKWLQHQMANYKKNTWIMKDPVIKAKWEEFTNTYKEYFPNNTTNDKIKKKATIIDDEVPLKIIVKKQSAKKAIS